MATHMATVLLGILASLGTLVGGLGAIAWLIAPRVKQWLRDELIQPTQETHQAVTSNHHTSDPPSILDRLDDLATQVTQAAESNARQETKIDGLRAAQGVLNGQFRTLREHFDAHVAAAGTSSGEMWRAIEAIAKAEPPHQTGDAK